MKNNKMNNPLFIIASGCSGTSVFYNHLGIHTDLCWFSNYSYNYPKQSYIAYLHRILEMPVFGTSAKKNMLRNKRFALRPGAGGNINHKYYRFTPAKKTTETDVDEIQKGKLIEILEDDFQHLGYISD